MNVPRENLILVIKERHRGGDPTPLNPHTKDNRDKYKYCVFHWDHGHNMESCFQLKRTIERSIKEGHLKEFRVDLIGSSKQVDITINTIMLEIPSIS